MFRDVVLLTSLATAGANAGGQVLVDDTDIKMLGKHFAEPDALSRTKSSHMRRDAPIAISEDGIGSKLLLEGVHKLDL